MNESLLTHRLADVQYCLAGLSLAFYRLVMIVGRHSAGKTALLRRLSEVHSYPLLNLNLELSQRLLDEPRAVRGSRIATLAVDLICDTGRQQPTETVLVDNIELLFDPTLHLNPLQVLQNASRHVNVVAAWNGEYRDGTLIYAEPGHPEYHSLTLTPSDGSVISLP